MHTIKDNILYFNDSFNESIDTMIFPDGIIGIIFGNEFNKPIDKVKFPETLVSITFGKKFSYPISGRDFPKSLSSFTFDREYLKHIIYTNDEIQEKLKKLIKENEIREKEITDIENNLKQISSDVIIGNILDIENSSDSEKALSDHTETLSGAAKEDFLESYEAQKKIRDDMHVKKLIMYHKGLISSIFHIYGDVDDNLRKNRIIRYIHQNINIESDDTIRFELLNQCIVGLSETQKKEIIDLYNEYMEKKKNNDESIANISIYGGYYGYTKDNTENDDEDDDAEDKKTFIESMSEKCSIM
jgi:hypothetical protein